MKKKFAIFSLSIALILGMILLSVGQQPMLLPGFNLTDLIDVNAASPSDGYVIIWDSATGKWIPASSGGGAGDVTGPGSSTDNAIATFNLATGKIIQQNHSVLISDTSVISGIVGPLGFTQNSDTITLSHDGTNAYFKTDDGNFVFQTDEGTNTDTIFDIKPKGTSNAVYFRLWDIDSEELQLFTAASRAKIRSSHTLGINDNALSDVYFFENAASGNNPSVHIYGYVTAGTSKRYIEFTMSDVNDEFLIQAENNANHEGITVSLPEANQAFRVRDSGAAVKFMVDNTGGIFPAGMKSGIDQANAGAAAGELYIDTDDGNTIKIGV